MQVVASALMMVLSPMGLLVNVAGVVLGIIFGAMPGLNGVVGVALLLPLTYGMLPEFGLIMLSGLYMGSTYGGSISAVLLNCPGTGEAACTAIEGHAMAEKGRAKEALSLSVLASGFGGLFGVVVMMLFTPILTKLALKFGPAELFLVCVAGLAIVGSLMGKSLPKGFFSVGVGLLLAIVGMDNMSTNYRFTFGNYHLQAGLSLIPISVGLFAISEMLALSTNYNDAEGVSTQKDAFRVWDGIHELFQHRSLLTKSAVIGTLIGVLPGTGGAIASFIAYGVARQSSKCASLFGQGNPEGIIAPECANNAAVGGSFVPLLSLGIPGSATSAIIFGALTIHGLIPGPKLMTEHADVVYALMMGLFLSTLLMVVFGLLGGKGFARILRLKTKYIVPAVLAFSLFGAYSARNSMFDVLIAVVFGLVGLLFKRNQIPVAPAVLGLILGGMAEQNLRQAMVIARAKQVGLLQFILFRPTSVVILIIIALLVYGSMKTTLQSDDN